MLAWLAIVCILGAVDQAMILCLQGPQEAGVSSSLPHLKVGTTAHILRNRLEHIDSGRVTWNRQAATNPWP